MLEVISDCYAHLKESDPPVYLTDWRPPSLVAPYCQDMSDKSISWRDPEYVRISQYVPSLEHITRPSLVVCV